MKHYESSKSKTTTWLTPMPLIKAMGEFDLDPCGYLEHQTANHVMCWPTDGLKEPWCGRVWLNPPYGAGIRDWLWKLCKHRCGTALVPARTETKWFQEAVKQCNAALFIEKRISFLTPVGKPVDGNTVGSVLLAYGVYDREKLRNSGIPGWLVIQ